MCKIYFIHNFNLSRYLFGNIIETKNVSVGNEHGLLSLIHDNYEGTFSMLKSFNTYNEEIAGYCKLQLFLLNGVASENKKNNIEKDF